ncbi:MAG: AAA family ATPase, partial [Ignavibacteria bacterium]|nr:AAA family ATPase [Ignavibacteria bacterium]
MLTVFQLKNFKCFSELSLNFNPLTILSGINGTGKSSV